MSEVQLLDHVTAGLDRLPSMWNDKPVAKGILQTYLETLQQVEILLHDINTQRSLYTAIGNQLNILGALFNVAREGRLDEEYRQAIIAKIASSINSGTADEIKNIARAITGATTILTFEHFPAAAYVFVNRVASATVALEIDRSHIAGVRARTGWFDGDDYFTPATIRSSIEANLADEDGNLILVDTVAGEYELVVDIDGSIITANSGFTSLIPGFTGYEVIDQRGRFASIAAISSEQPEIGYLIDNNNNLIVDNENTYIQYIEL
jgi:hypothetical protein